MLLAGVPVLAGSMLLAARGAPAAMITWLGSVGFLLYNSLMFVFAPPANQFFLLYLVMPALGAWSAGAVLWQADVAAFGGLFSRRTPGRGIAVCLWVVVALNAVTWTARRRPDQASAPPDPQASRPAGGPGQRGSGSSPARPSAVRAYSAPPSRATRS